MVASLKELKNLIRISPSPPNFLKATPNAIANTIRPRMFIPSTSVPTGTYTQVHKWTAFSSWNTLHVQILKTRDYLFQSCVGNIRVGFYKLITSSILWDREDITSHHIRSLWESVRQCESGRVRSSLTTQDRMFMHTVSVSWLNSPTEKQQTPGWRGRYF